MAKDIVTKKGNNDGITDRPHSASPSRIACPTTAFFHSSTTIKASKPPVNNPFFTYAPTRLTSKECMRPARPA